MTLNKNKAVSYETNRRHFSEYNFEQQAAILRDAYLYFHTKEALLHNQEFVKRSDYWDNYYNSLLEEFREWHRDLQRRSLSPDYISYN